MLRLVAHSRRGKDVTHAFRREAQFCTVLTSFEAQTPTALSIQAACPVQVLALSRAQLAVLYRQLPTLEALFAQLIRHQVVEKLALHRAYLGLDAAARYETFLARQPEIAGRVSQQLVASYLNMTPQSLSRLRQQRRAGP